MSLITGDPNASRVHHERLETKNRRWWFASKAIPLIAATLGPLTSVLSIAALVSPWRLTLPDHGQLPDGNDNNGVGIADPHWSVNEAIGSVCTSLILIDLQGTYQQRLLSRVWLRRKLVPFTHLHPKNALSRGPTSINYLLHFVICHGPYLV